MYARREAVDHLERMLLTPDDLSNLSMLLVEYETERKGTKDQLSSVLTGHMRELRHGLEALERAQDALASFETRFASIEALCAECASLVQMKPGIRSLGAVHTNLRQTLNSAEAVATLPRQAADAEKLLMSTTDSAAGLVRAYLGLAELEATVVKVQHALEAFKAQQATAHLQVPSLEFYFGQVHRAMTKVEERIWSTIRAFRSMARRNPALLVAALQVIEIQEQVDRELLAAGQGGSKLRKGWRVRSMQQLAASLSESFASLLQRCSKLLAEDAAVEELLRDVLKEATGLVGELQGVRDYVVPCFPPHYAVMSAVCAETHAQVGNMLDLVGLSASRLSNGDILLCMKWVEEYEDTLKAMKQRVEDLETDGGIGTSGVTLLLETYVGRVQSTLETWLHNIVDRDFKNEPSTTQEGKLWTPGPVDLYRILDEQLALAANAGGVLMRRVVAEAARMMRSFQQATLAKLASSAHPLEVLCAVANNSQRCRTLGSEFMGKAKDGMPQRSPRTLPLEAAGEADLANACASFEGVGEVAIAACVEAVFADPGFGELFAVVGNSDKWLNGTVTGSVLATIEDFLHDFETWLQPPLYIRLVELMLGETTAHFIAAVTMQLKAVREEDLKALRRDASKLKKFFSQLVSEERAEAQCQPLTDIVDFLASDSVESFVLSYTTLLESAPGISPVLLSNLLSARVATDEDMTKADAKEVMEACRQVFSARKQPAGGASGQATWGGVWAGALKGRATLLPGSRDAAFLAALNAARRRPDSSSAANFEAEDDT